MSRRRPTPRSRGRPERGARAHRRKRDGDRSREIERAAAQHSTDGHGVRSPLTTSGARPRIRERGHQPIVLGEPAVLPVRFGDRRRQRGRTCASDTTRPISRRSIREIRRHVSPGGHSRSPRGPEATFHLEIHEDRAGPGHVRVRRVVMQEHLEEPSVPDSAKALRAARTISRTTTAGSRAASRQAETPGNRGAGWRVQAHEPRRRERDDPAVASSFS